MARKIKRKKFKYQSAGRKYKGSRVWRLKDQENSTILEERYLLDKLGIDLRDGGATFHEFLGLNKKGFDSLGLKISLISRDNKGYLKVTSSNIIGAIPLLSLKNNDAVSGIYVEPNFSWSGFGEICDLIGWSLVPSIIEGIKLVPGGNKSIPSWLLAGPIIKSFFNALKRPGRNYITREEELSLIRGNVNYEKYIEKNLVSGKWQIFQCKYDDLSLDCSHHRYIVPIVKRLLSDLQKRETFNTSNNDIQKLGKIILKKLEYVNPKWPRSLDIDKLSFRGVWSKYKQGFKYSKWLLYQQGLGGPDDGEGLPWAVCSEELYELWVGYIAQKWAKNIGASIKTSSNRSSIIPIDWNVQYEKTMSYLIPDYVVERDEEVWVFDAKYKNLIKDLVDFQWYQLDDSTKEAHRSDLHQILAYSSAYNKDKIVSILAYPFDYIGKSEKLIKYTRIGKFSQTFGRNVWIVLIPIPMGYTGMGGLQNVVGEIIAILNNIRNTIGTSSSMIAKHPLEK